MDSITKQLNLMKEQLANKEINVQQALNYIMELSFRDPNSNAQFNAYVMDIYEDRGINSVNDVARTLRETITNELNTDCEIDVAPDAEDLAYIDKHQELSFVFSNAVDTPISKDDVYHIIKSLKQVVSSVKEA